MPDEMIPRPREHENGDSEPNDNGSAGQPVQGPKKPPLTPLQATVTLLKRGRREMLPRLRELLQEQPEIWQYVGDLAAQSRRAWIELIGGDDDLLKESMALFIEEQKKALAGERPTPIEELLVERIIAHQLRVTYLEASEAENDEIEGTPLGDFRLKKQELADRQLDRAMKLLESVRAMLARTKALEQRAAATSDNPTRYAELESNATRQPAPMLGVNRINGHDRSHALPGACVNSQD